jgi:hypothetical protein
VLCDIHKSNASLLRYNAKNNRVALRTVVSIGTLMMTAFEVNLATCVMNPTCWATVTHTANPRPAGGSWAEANSSDWPVRRTRTARARWPIQSGLSAGGAGPALLFG